MWSELALVLQLLADQPETVLSDIAEKELRSCLKTGICNRHSSSIICSSLKCYVCDEIIGLEWFTTSCAIWRNPYIIHSACKDDDYPGSGTRQWTKKEEKEWMKEAEKASKEFANNMAEDEKIVHPGGRDSKANWEALLLKRGVSPTAGRQSTKHSTTERRKP